MGDNTKPTYSRMAQFLGEVYLKEGYGNEPVNTGEDDEAPGVKSKKGAPKKKKKKKKTKLDPNNPYAREERGSGWGRDPYIGTAPKKKVNESERIKRADMSHGLKREDAEQAAWNALTPAQKARLKRIAKAKKSKETKKSKKVNDSIQPTYDRMAEILSENIFGRMARAATRGVGRIAGGLSKIRRRGAYGFENARLAAGGTAGSRFSTDLPEPRGSDPEHYRGMYQAQQRQRAEKRVSPINIGDPTGKDRDMEGAQAMLRRQRFGDEWDKLDVAARERAKERKQRQQQQNPQ